MKLGDEGEARKPDTVFLRIALLCVFALVVGIVLLPMGSAQKGGLWSSICSALGIGTGAPAPAPPYETSSRLGSLVSWTAPTDRMLAGGDLPDGRAVASARCDACHGAEARAANPMVPYLDGFSRKAIYKELADYHSGRRVAAIMNGIAGQLTPNQMRDLASYYAGLNRQAGVTRPTADTDAGRSDPIVKLVYQGDPSRDIAPCAACHGPDGKVAAAPVLFGQSEAYLATQLRAFRFATRHNDNLAQMRTPAHALDDREIAELAAYLSPSGSLPGP